MSFYEGGLDKLAALCVGTTAVAFGNAPTGLIEATVGVAGLIGFVLAREEKFGPECHRIRRRIQSDILKSYDKLLAGSDNKPEARELLVAADLALRESLEKCFINRDRLAASAVTPAGFLNQAVLTIMEALAEVRPDLFSHDNSPSLAHRFAADVVRAGISAAIEDLNYYRQIESKIALEMAKSIGYMREKIDIVALEINKLNKKNEMQVLILEQLADMMGGISEREKFLSEVHSSQSSAIKALKYADHGVRNKLLESAILARDIQTMEAILDVGVVIDNNNFTYGSPLELLLCEYDDSETETIIDILEVFLDAGADVNQKCMHGSSLIALEASLERMEMLKYLVKKGANIRHRDDEGETALFGAASFAAEEAVKFLLDCGADPTISTKNGWTPLMGASSLLASGWTNEEDEAKRIRICDLLLSHGGSLEIHNDAGQTALELAKNSGLYALYSYLDVRLAVGEQPSETG